MTISCNRPGGKGSDIIYGGEGNDFISSAGDLLSAVRQRGPNDHIMPGKGELIARDRPKHRLLRFHREIEPPTVRGLSEKQNKLRGACMA